MKLKTSQNNIELLNNSSTQTNIQIIFSFNTTLLPNAKKYIGKIKPHKYDDLTTPGSSVRIDDGQIILLSLGEINQFNLVNYKKTLNAIAQIIKNNSKIDSISLITEDSLSANLNLTDDEFTQTSLFYLLNGLYSYEELKTSPKKLSLKTINIITRTLQKAALQNAIYMAEGIFLIKDLAHGPANIVTPTYLAKTAKHLEKIGKTVKVEILDKKDIKKLKMNAFLAVAQGADSEPKFIKMEYFGAAKNKQPIVLIGKGITFDSGGISLKPGAKMDAMKYDMCGAATVIGIFKTVANLNLPINLVCLVPSCENMPSGRAVKPEKYKPELVIDIATLTGACIVALGSAVSGLYSNDDTLATELIKSGLDVDDKVWRMPLFKEYHDMLKGTVADLSNISWSGEAGSVLAACFLEQFTDYKWAHLDIAGTAMSGTGRPFYMLMDFLCHFKV
ncbi:MAG: leucyl aminopeptidase [Burkholderiales bacterium]|nr:leucyl aminopeptidase [Burkholderiales bacterium]